MLRHVLPWSAAAVLVAVWTFLNLEAASEVAIVLFAFVTLVSGYIAATVASGHVYRPRVPGEDRAEIWYFGAALLIGTLLVDFALPVWVELALGATGCGAAAGLAFVLWRERPGPTSPDGG